MVTLYAADGQLDVSDMTNATAWPQVRTPVFLDNLKLNNQLNTPVPNTAGDSDPMVSSETDISSMTATGPSSVKGVTFNVFVQFEPSGEARIKTTEPTRNIKIALDNVTQSGRNPFILRLSGMNGTVVVLRKEDGITD